MFYDALKKIDLSKWKEYFLNEQSTLMKRGYLELFFLILSIPEFRFDNKMEILEICYKELQNLLTHSKIHDEKNSFPDLIAKDRNLYNAYLVLFILNSLKNKKPIEKL